METQTQHQEHPPTESSMKQTLVLAFSFLAFLTNLPSAFSDNAPTPVLDVMNNTVETDRQYYIIPSIRGPPGGGLKLAKTGNSDLSCKISQKSSVAVLSNSPPAETAL